MADPLSSDIPGAPARIAAAAVAPSRTRAIPRDWAGAQLVARREIDDLLSDWRILGPALLLVVVFPILMVIMSAEGRIYLLHHPGSVSFSIVTLIPFAMMLIGFFPVSFSLIIGLESFAGEKERNTLEALLATPLSDRALYLGKMLAALALPLAGSLVSMGIYLGGVIAFVGYRPEWLIVGALLLLSVAQALLLVAAALIVSSHTTSVRAANLLAAFIILPLSVLIQANNALILWGGAAVLPLIALAIAVFAVLLIRSGLRLFNREQILAREMDDLRPRQLLGTFRLFLRLPPRAALAARSGGAAGPASRPFSLRRLYGHDIPVLLRLRWPELGIVTLTLIAALALGWGVAAFVPLSLGDILGGDLSRAALADRLQSAAGLQGGGGLLGGMVLNILSGLLRLLLLSVVLIILAVISFGTLPLLFMMLIAALAGFVLAKLALAGLSLAVLGGVLLFPSVLFPALAILLLTAFAARFGLAVAVPPPGFGLGESLLLALAEYVKIAALALPLLLLGEVIQTIVLALAGAFL
ncbi:MAG TPA: ABC transporter permease subunit [Chloroflexia bacterium]|nr:ABC transporter permease subunit [Chloroflexia bacterium]